MDGLFSQLIALGTSAMLLTAIIVLWRRGVPAYITAYRWQSWLLGLLTAPAGAAHLLSASPYRALALSGGLAVAAMWLGLTISYEIPKLPPSSCVIAVAAASYLLAFALAGDASRWLGRDRMCKPQLD